MARTAQLGLWDLPALPPRRWVPRCDDCHRRVWASTSLHRRFGRLLGGGCYRKRVRATRRLTIALHIRVTDPGHVRGQIEIDTT